MFVRKNVAPIILSLLVFNGCITPEPVSGSVNYIQENINSFDGKIIYKSRFFHMLSGDQDKISSPFSASIYFDPSVEPWIIVSYRDSMWFFLDKLEIKTDYGEIFSMDGYLVSREVHPGYVDEIMYFKFPPKDLISMSKSNKLEFRFSGTKIGSSKTNFVHGNFIWALRQFVNKFYNQ
jgi:hypothetical protein